MNVGMMMIRNLKRSVLILLIGFFSIAGWAKDKPVQTPQFSSVTQSGEAINLSDFQGKVVLLDFWASWCGPCRKEMPFLVDQYNEKKELGFVVLAVNLDNDVKNMKKFLSDLDKMPDFPILRDPDETICPLFNLEGMPTSVLIDRQGMLRFRHVGFKDEIRENLLHEIDLLISEK